MALVNFFASPFRLPYVSNDEAAWSLASATALNAVNLSTQFLGHIVWADGGTHTVSSAGGKIGFSLASATWADAGSTVNVGIQDQNTILGAAGRGDGTFDVFSVHAGGDASLAAGWNTCNMASGSKSLAHGAQIAVVIAMTARGGTDAITVQGLGLGTLDHHPLTVHYNSGTLVSSAIGVRPNVLITADDGTLGTLYETAPVSNFTELAAFHSGSTPDEYGNVFTLPFGCNVGGLWTEMNVSTVDSDFEIILYSDPLVNPVAERTVTVSAATLAGTATTSERLVQVPIAPITLLPGTAYAVAVRPTTTNSLQIFYAEVAAQAHFGVHSMGDTLHYATRTNQTGAFTRTMTRRLQTGFTIYGVHDGTGGGGGSSAFPIRGRSPSIHRI